MSAEPILHRDDPDRAPLAGHTKVTQEDWLRMARNTLVLDGVDQVKILALAERMQVSRSSFYWYFRDREELLQALLQDWEASNTARILAHCALPAASISAAVLNFFRCFIESNLPSSRSKSNWLLKINSFWNGLNSLGESSPFHSSGKEILR